MNILIVTEYYFPHIGGVEIVFKNLAEQLVKKGHKVKVVTSKTEGTNSHEVINDVEIFRVYVPKFADRYFFTFFSLPQIQKLAKWADIIHTTLYNAALPAKIAAKIRKKPTLITAHEVYGDRWHELFDMHRSSAALHKMLEKAILKLHFDEYISVSNATKKDLTRHKNEETITTIYNGIDYDFFNREKYADEAKKIRGDNKTYDILFYGRPGISKGVEYLIKGIKKVFDTIPEARLKLILSKKPAKGFKKIKKLIDGFEKKYCQRIRVIDPVDFADLPKNILASDLVVIPSLAEGFGFTTAECSALKMPMVVSEAGSLPEVASGKLVFCKPKDPESIADAIIKAYEGKFTNVNEKRFSWDENADKHLMIYDRVINNHYKKINKNNEEKRNKSKNKLKDNKHLRVAVLMDGWDPIVGGAQIHLKEAAKILTNKYNCEIDLFTRKLKNEKGEKFSNDESLLNGKFRVFRSGLCSDFFNIFGRLYWLIRPSFSIIYKHYFQKKYDLIHANAFLPSIPAKIAKLFIRRPIAYMVHGTSIGVKDEKKSKTEKLLQKIERYLVCRIKYDKEISVAENFLGFKNVNKNIEIIANGVNVADFDAVESKKNKSFTILYVGRFDKIKGVNVLIEAFRKLLTKNNEKVKLNLVGYGYDEKNLKNLVKKYELNDSIKFLGKKTGNELIKIYKNSHLFVLPSLSEGQPLTLLEAFAAKLPIVATDVGDNKKFIEEANGGYIAKPASSDDLKNEILKALKNNNISQMGENGYKMVKNNYSWQNTAKKIFAVWNNLNSIK